MESNRTPRDKYGDRACDLSYEAYGDLLEYCHGDNSTEWGRLRISDGHPAPYDVHIFEIGNEQVSSEAGQRAVLFFWHGS